MVSHTFSKSSFIGAASSAFEWYDYALFGHFAATISKQFFPSTDPMSALLSSFAIFATGFAMRPLGAILFGHVGDRVGRKKALMLSLFMMALPTTLLGLLPTYEMIGSLATWSLVAIRLLQGLAVGGNYGGSFIFTIEYADPKHRGLAGSFATFGTLGGILLGSGVAYLFSKIFTEGQMESYGWRVPFLLGGLSAVLAHYMRKAVPEHEETGHKGQAPLKDILKTHLWDVAQAMGIILLDGVGVYVLFVFMITFATTFLHLDHSAVLLTNTLTMALLVISIPFFGHLSDKIGARRVLKGAAIGFLFLSYPLYALLVNTPSLENLILLQAIFALIVGAVYGSIPLTIVTLFPHSLRYTACGVAFNLSMAFFGGTAPYLVTKWIGQTGNLLTPGIVLTVVGVISLTCLLTLKAPCKINDDDVLSD